MYILFRRSFYNVELYLPTNVGLLTPWLSKEAISIADERKDAKRVGDKDKVRSLNRAFQKKAREDKKTSE